MQAEFLKTLLAVLRCLAKAGAGLDTMILNDIGHITFSYVAR